METYVWLALFVLFLFIEAITPAFVSIWFAGGSLLALIISIIGLPLWLQIAVFAVSSILLMILTRPMYNKYIKARIVRTNLDSLIGEPALVTQDIDNIQYTGEAKVNGRLWTARVEDGSSASAGEIRRVVEISGTKLILSKNIENKEN